MYEERPVFPEQEIYCHSCREAEGTPLNPSRIESGLMAGRKSMLPWGERQDKGIRERGKRSTSEDYYRSFAGHGASSTAPTLLALALVSGKKLSSLPESSFREKIPERSSWGYWAAFVVHSHPPRQQWMQGNPEENWHYWRRISSGFAKRANVDEYFKSQEINIGEFVEYPKMINFLFHALFSGATCLCRW